MSDGSSAAQALSLSGRCIRRALNESSCAPWSSRSELTAQRKQRNLTQQALADMADIHVSQVRRYEGGGAMPTLDVLKKLTVALSTSADSLVFDDHERDPDDVPRQTSWRTR